MRSLLTNEARCNCANGSSDYCRSLDHFDGRCKLALGFGEAGLRDERRLWWMSLTFMVNGQKMGSSGNNFNIAVSALKPRQISMDQCGPSGPPGGPTTPSYQAFHDTIRGELTNCVTLNPQRI
jgi:hypothetical protein